MAVPAAPVGRVTYEPAMATILVVDDNPAVARMMARLLESKGYHAVLAPDGPSALDAVRSATPPVDLVLLDMMMPDMDGLEVLRRLRSESRGGTGPRCRSSCSARWTTRK